MFQAITVFIKYFTVIIGLVNAAKVFTTSGTVSTPMTPGNG